MYFRPDRPFRQYPRHAGSENTGQRDAFFIWNAPAQIAGIADHQGLGLVGTAPVAQGEGDIAAGIAAIALEHNPGPSAAADQAGIVEFVLAQDQVFIRLTFAVGIAIQEPDPAFAPVEAGGAADAVVARAKGGAGAV